MKYKLPIIILFISLNIFFIRRELNYPSNWNQIHVGMSRQQVYSLIGKGSSEFKGWKGPFWRDSKIFVWHELELSIKSDKVSAVKVHRYLGNHTSF